MAEDTAPAEVVVVKRPLWQRILKWIGIAILSLVVLALVVLFGINTDPGRRFVANQIGGYTTASGLNIRVGRINGSLYGKMSLSDLRVSDTRGVFLTAPRLDVDWRPFAFVNNHVDVRALDAGLVTLARRPVLKATPPTDENAPLLPDLDIDVNRLKIARFVIGAPVTGQVHVLSIDGQAHIADRRAQLVADAAALRAPGVAGGDRMRLRLDAVPDDNKLNVDLKVQAPTGGVIATMGGLKAPMTVSVDGRGSWASWQGRAVATLGGGQLANLAVTARNGHIEVRGPMRPGLYLEGPVERLTAPQLDVAIDTTLNERRADTRITMKSDALAVDAGGMLDLANSRFGNFAVDAKLLTPGAIAPNLNGRDVSARLVLDGAFATPTVDYKVRAAAMGFGEMGVQDFYAEGLARVNADRIIVPIKARAKRIVGLPDMVGGLANNATIQGDLAIAMPTILSDNLRIRSDNVDATAILAANMQTGRYTGALKGRINNYRIDSIGIVNVTTDANLVTTPNGFGVKGRVVAQTKQLFNDGLRTFLGGNAIVRADVGYDPKGLVTFSGVRMNAPQFRITRGQGSYRLDTGAVLVDADAYSTQYGPISARITGSAAAPVVVVRAARPGVGVGLNNVQARIVGRNGAYAVTASGGTNYGPFTADVVVRPGAQLAIDVRRVVFAGIAASGRLVQTAAGPFAGSLRFAGQGLVGDVQLANQGGYQRAHVAARAYNAVIPGIADFTVGRAIVDATAVLTPTPQVVADVQVADTRYNAVVIQSARAKVNYVGGRGTAQALVTGSSGVPFRVAVNAKLAPNDYLIAAQGSANNIAFRTVNPAHVTAARGVYQLAPTRIDFGGGASAGPGGSLRLAGTYGRGMNVQARLDRLDLSFANALVPNLGVAGQATGSLTFAQASSTAFPTADVRVTIANFQRTGLAAVSQAVDVVFAGRLDAAGGQARALVRRGQQVVGRMVTTLTPSGTGSWSQRLMAGTLGGGIRYNGPSSVLFSFAALPNQQLNGAIALAADVSGRVNAPQVTGLIRADNLTYDNETYGTRLSQMRIAGRFTNDRLEITTLDARAGDGTVKAQGSIGLAAAAGFPIDFRATLDNAQLAKSDDLGATASGTVHLVNGPQGGLIEGDINIPEARYAIIRQGSAEVPELTGVRRRSQIRVARPTDRPVPPTPPSTFKLNVRIHADNQLFVSGMGLESEWKMDMRVTGTSNAPVITGGLDLIRGTYSFAGKRFEVTRGVVRFRGGALTDPDINIQASTTVNGVTAVINVTGTGQRPQISFTSTPNLPQDEVLSRLLFGSSPENLSATEAIQLAAALNSLRGSGGGGLNPLGKLRSATGFDRLRVLGADDSTGRGTSLAAGKYLTNNIYVEIVTDSKGFTATQLEVALTKALSLLSSTGSFGGTAASLRYSKDY